MEWLNMTINVLIISKSAKIFLYYLEIAFIFQMVILLVKSITNDTNGPKICAHDLTNLFLKRISIDLKALI